MLKELNWLSIYQLVYYHSLRAIWKVFSHGEPYNNLKNLTDCKNNTGKIILTKTIWSIEAKKLYWQLPVEIISAKKIEIFKSRLKNWISKSIPIEETENDLNL